MPDAEVALFGGRITPGIVRVGNTVRRPMTGDRSAVHSLLRHLEESGFDGVPRFLGVDDRAREILSFLPGEVPRDLDHFSDAQLMAAARLLRRFHDATAVLATGQADEVICHNDWGPHNAVFQDGLPYGIIDFDTIAAGLRLWDIGYSAFSWLDMGNSDYSGEEQIRRLGVFAEGYGVAAYSVAQIAVFAVARQTALGVAGRRKGKHDLADWADGTARWTVQNVLEQLLPTRM